MSHFFELNVPALAEERPGCKRFAVQLGVYVVQTLDQLCFIPKHVVQAGAASLELFDIPFTILRLRRRFEPQQRCYYPYCRIHLVSPEIYVLLV